MRSNEIKIILENYHQALQETIHDEKWISNAMNYPEIFNEYFQTSNNVDVINEQISISDIIEYRQKNNLFSINENVFRFKENKKKYLIENVDHIYQKTSYYANIVANLLQEFSQNTRIYDSYKLSPLPENVDDTYLPISKFKMICKNGECQVKIIRGGLKVTNHEELTDYFNKRILSKFLKTAYLDNIHDEENCRRRLLFMKSIPLQGVKILSKLPSKYKVIYKGNQTVAKDNNEFSITDEPVNVMSIRKL